MWTPTPTTWDNSFLETLFGYEWNVALSPAGLWQWVPSDGAGAGTVPDAHDPTKTHAPTMLTTDLALQEDPLYAAIARRFLTNPDQLADAFARAWFKLTHIDMGPIQRYLGPLVPSERLIWQDPVPRVDHELVDADDIVTLKSRLLGLGPVGIAARLHGVGLGFDVPQQRQARRGERGAHPSRTAAELGGQRSRDAGARAAHAGGDREAVQRLPTGGQEDLAGRSDRARWVRGNRDRRPPAPVTTSRYRSGRDVPTRPRSGPTPSGSPRSSQPRTHSATTSAITIGPPPEALLVDRASQLTLSATEMTVLLGGLRVLGANHGQSPVGVFTSTPGSLTTDFFINLLDTGTEWVPRTRPRREADDLRGPRPAHRRGQVDRQSRRPRIQGHLRVACTLGGLRQPGRRGEVRPRFRVRVGQGHEPRLVRPVLIASQYERRLVACERHGVTVQRSCLHTGFQSAYSSRCCGRTRRSISELTGGPGHFATTCRRSSGQRSRTDCFRTPTEKFH